jgi:hypothetical protein
MTRWIVVGSMALLVSLTGAPLPGQTAGTGVVMRQKLADAQAVLEAITTSDYTMLLEHSTALRRSTQALGWQVLKTPEYRRYSNAFVNTAENLADAAADRNFDAAVTYYMSMTLTCYQCHRYMMAARIASR